MDLLQRPSSRLPDFLIIGAMKAGTTSLYRDLRLNPGLFLPTVKEPHFLCDDNVLTPSGQRCYAKLFSGSTRAQLCGEASTGYTKLPDIPGVPQRAKQLLGENIRIVYLVRHPIERALSHYYHLRRAGDTHHDLNSAVRQIPQLIEYSRYAAQLQPWYDLFDPSSFCVIRFEDYISRRHETLVQVSRFLGVQPEVASVDINQVVNARSNSEVPRPAFKQMIRSLTRSRWYKLNVHSRIPGSLRSWLKSLFMTKQSHPFSLPRSGTLDYLREQLLPDAIKLQDTLHQTHPLWHFGDSPVDKVGR